jgi:hypothetical protein
MLARARTARYVTLAPLAALLGLVTAVSTGACSSGPTALPGTIGSGTPDHPSAQALSIDDAGLSATVTDRVLRVALPVHASAAARGSLNLSIRGLDGSTPLSSITLAYDLTPGDATLHAELTLPGDVTAQPDLVRYVLRIDDGKPDSLQVTASLLRVVVPYEVRLEGPASVVKDKPGRWRVRAQNALTRQPIAGQPVQLLLKNGDAATQTRTATTGEGGDAVFDLTLPGAGTWSLVASAAAQGTQANVVSPLAYTEPGPRMLLTTDKPIYQPGQLVHIRTLTLDALAGTPVAKQAAVFEVFDGKGNKLLKRDGTTDAFGIAATDFELGSVLNEGDFKIQATVGSAVVQKTVKVSHYALPKFRADVATDKGWYLPGQQLQATVDAGYFFGKPVATADVAVEASTLDVGQTVFQKVQGKTDANGKYAFSIQLPVSLVGLPLERGNALVHLAVKVTDTAGQEITKDLLVTISQNGLDVALVPEATTIVADVDNELDLFVADPAGGPVVAAPVTLSVDKAATPLTATTDAYGQATFHWNPGQSCVSGCTFVAGVNTGGKLSTRSFTFGAQSGSAHVLVRTDKAVYGVGDTVTVDVKSTLDTGNVYVDWIQEGQTVDMRTLSAVKGAAQFKVTIDPTRTGRNRIEAYVIDKDGNVVRTGRTVYVKKSGALNVALATDKPQYAPGEKAHLSFKVTDETGAPTVAALGVQIVDEAVFSLVDAQPGLLRTYFELDELFSQPQYEIEAPLGDLGSVAVDAQGSDPKSAAAAQKKAAGLLAAMRDGAAAGLALGSWPVVVSVANTQLQPYFKAIKTANQAAMSFAAMSAKAELESLGCTPQQYYCQAKSTYFGQAFVDLLVSRAVMYDFWGNRYHVQGQPWSNAITFTSDGPDERAGTGDEGSFSYDYTELGVPDVLFYGMTDGAGPGGPPGAPGGGGGWADAGAASDTGVTLPTVPGDDGGTGAAAPRVRSYFPETLFVHPALITDSTGVASLDLDMADSITRWRVSSLANAANGKLGGGLDGITVFQDFFTDVNFPSSLTLGDKVEFPITVYNYLSTPQTVTLSLAPGDWYTPLGATSTVVPLAAGQVLGLRFPVRVDKVGVHALTVKAIGSALSDAVARTVRVDPGGKALPTSVSGSVGAGAITQTFDFPANAIAGSPSLFVDVFPAYLAQAVQGMDSLLRVPSGCFEQTTSTTWPNVLVMDYVTRTHQSTPAIQMKADSLISAGYQRLLTFEHPGGGFSWFGTQDPAPFLSVTAFGVMEFADMAKVHTVDPAMLNRTIAWLVKQEQSDGSFKGDTSEFFSFQTSTVRNTAFVLWALEAAGYTGPAVDSSLAYLRANAAVPTQDAYTLGILANALQLAAPNAPITQSVFDRIDATKKTATKGISWSAAGTQTNFYGAGNDADVSSTALIASALVTRGGYPDSVKGAFEYLTSSRDPNGNFGSTQATIWTLRALLLAASKGTDTAVGSLEVALDGKPFSTLDLRADQSDVMSTVDLGSALALTPGAGTHSVRLTFVGTGKASYHIVSGYNVAWADVPPEPTGPLSVSVSYDKTSLALNETVKETVHLVNNTASTQNMVLVTLGIAPGFTVEMDDLLPYLASGVLSKAEPTGKQLTLYLTKLGPSATLDLAYHLRATMPVTASDGGGEAHLYYEPEKRSAVASTTFTVSP